MLDGTTHLLVPVNIRSAHQPDMQLPVNDMQLAQCFPGMHNKSV